MTVSTQVSRNEYTGNGATTQYDFTFRILDKSHLLVQTLDNSESIVTLTLGTDYTVTGVNRYNGGKVVLTSALPAGYKISIERSTPVTQEASIRNQGGFFPEIHEDAFDKLTMLVQQAYGWWSGLSLRKPSWLANYYDALNNRIRNLRDPSQAQDAATKNYVDLQIVDNTNAWKAGDIILDQKIDSNFARTLRVPESTVDQLSPVSVRKNSLLGWDSNGKPIPVFSMTDTADLAIKLASHEDGLGMSLLGMPGSGSLNQLIGKWTCPEAWGVITDSQSDAHANSKKMFNMFEWLRSLGGGVAYFTPGKTYWIDFIQFVPSNVVIIGYGATVKQINPLSMYGRGGFVFGSGREWNYQKAKAAYNSGNYPSSVADSTMAELPLKSYLRDNQSYVQCEKCKVYGLRMSAVFTDSSYWGGYAFNCVNAQHIRFFDVVGDGWTQLFNFGNDSIASSPSCYDVIARGSTIEKPDLVRTYYAYGFMANSTDCWIEDSNLLTPMTAGTLNGSGAAVNMVENCGFRNLTAKKLGRTVSSEMVLLNNAKGCLVENIDVGDCINGVATYYTDDSYNDLNMPNVIRNISAEADNVIALRAKYAIIDSFHGKGAYINELYFANNNASGNKINKNPKSIGFGGTNLQSWFLTNNTVLGWFRRYFYLRPAEIILNDKADTLSWTFNKLVSTKNGVDLYFMWRVPDDIKAIDDIRAFIRFNISSDQNAAAAGSTVEASLIQMISFDGDINTDPYTAFSNSKVAASGVENTTIVTQMGSTAPGFVKMADETHGLAYSWYVLFKMTHNVNNNYMKEIRIAGYN